MEYSALFDKDKKEKEASSSKKETESASSLPDVTRKTEEKRLVLNNQKTITEEKKSSLKNADCSSLVADICVYVAVIWVIYTIFKLP